MSHHVTYSLPERVRGAGGSSPIVASDVVADSAPVSHGKLSLGRILRWGLMVLSLVLFVRMAVTNHSEISEAIGHLFTRSGWLVAAALLLEGVWVYSLSNVYRSSIQGLGGSLGRGQALRISMGAFSLSRILPGGGAAGSIFAARAIAAHGNPVPRTVASMLISWWVSMSALALVVGVGTASGLAGDQVGTAHLVGPALVFAVLAVAGTAVIVALRIPRLRARVARGLSVVGSRLGVSAEAGDWESQAMTPVPVRRLIPLMGWAALSWIVDAAALWVMFLGFGVRLHPAVLLVGYGLANLINALPELTPGWLGVLESALAATYAALGVPVGIAVMAVLAYRLVSYWLPVAVGIGPALGMLRGRSSPVEDDRAARELEAVA
ncbi:MAG TPA: lysylphosphatidylglycerol synthase transmembrane domain-containing protein [Acidimicrobiia bacterium]|nr:lysylphosphatidylglycerol synthase transmembrane domain-containing protein [Acidimicrobiia bacterium]